MRRLGHLIDDRYVRDRDRNQTHMTRFLRNAPQLEVLRERLGGHEHGATVKIASVGCSSGAELYSLLWVARNSPPDLHIVAVGVDASPRVLDVARTGVYQIATPGTDHDLDDCGRVAAPVSEFLKDWPWKRWSHEPFDRRRPDWAFRYSTIFVRTAPQVGVAVQS
jgi:hypothetical protein